MVDIYSTNMQSIGGGKEWALEYYLVGWWVDEDFGLL